jgi:hypothetical protein
MYAGGRKTGLERVNNAQYENQKKKKHILHNI